MNQSLLVKLYYVYRHPSRKYHGLDHITNCFREMDDAKVHIVSLKALRFAIWFHDYIYDPLRHDNEEMSAKCGYEAAIECGYQDDFAFAVKNMILVTKHDPNEYPALTIDEKLICDIDLSSLAVEPEQFEINSDLIRQEYAAVPDERFYPARTAILGKFLKRPSIYYTDHFREKYEDKARANLLRAVATVLGQG